MPKINQEEYEVLKGLDDRWKWIARDDENQIYSAEVHVFEKKPEREDGYWNNINCGEYELLREWDYLFQFIQWEDQEPYNISELIEEYEIKELRLAPSRTVIVDSFNESEEAEVKKDLKEAILGIEVTQFDGQKADLEELVHPKQLENVISDWMPEVLSQEWINDNKEMYLINDTSVNAVPEHKLRNLLVPKQELPVIPRFVADWYEKEGKKDNWWNWFYKWGRDESRTELETKTIGWMQDYNEEAFVNMFLHGYTVEKEQKYQVIIRDGEYMRLYLCKHDGNVTIGTNDNYIEKCPEVTYLTEQEIKDYDERYWAFAKPVEELEE